jgi:hypothetical protein
MTISTAGSIDTGLAVDLALDAESPAGGAALESGEALLESVFRDAEQRRAESVAASVREGALIAGLGGGEVTPEMILAIAQRRINDLDAQVTTLMDELTRRTTAASEISTEIGELRTISSDLEAYYDANGNLNPATRMTHMTPAPTVQEYLDGLRSTGVIDDSEHSAIMGGREGLDNLIQSGNDRLRDVNSGNEMLMIQLQSTMQTRTSVIQTATNLLKTIDEASDSIVGNLR